MSIVPSGIFDPPLPVSCAWDQFNHLEHFYFLPQELHDRLLELTPNADFALTIGMAEWIIARMAGFDPDAEARQYLAAAWAEMVPGWHCARFYPPDDEWRGPVRGVMATAMVILYDAMDGLGDNPELADRAVWMHNLARHVIEPVEPFDAWFEVTVSRLEHYHRRDSDPEMRPSLFADTFPRGRIVSMEALMPELTYNPDLAAQSVERFVERQRRDGNKFVLDDQEFD